jgi:hypothetical protein
MHALARAQEISVINVKAKRITVSGGGEVVPASSDAVESFKGFLDNWELALGPGEGALSQGGAGKPAGSEPGLSDEETPGLRLPVCRLSVWSGLACS